MKQKISFCCLLLIISNCTGYAQIHKSDKLKPRWIYNTPDYENDTYKLIKIYTETSSNLDGARMQAKKDLVSFVEKEESVKVTESYDYESSQENNNNTINVNEQDFYKIKIESGIKSRLLVYEKIDEYYEDEYKDGRHYFKLWSFFAVNKSGQKPVFDDFKYSSTYGVRGLVRSIIPGWGQIYKGSTTKGVIWSRGSCYWWNCGLRKYSF